jgi:hypothetical protein
MAGVLEGVGRLSVAAGSVSVGEEDGTEVGSGDGIGVLVAVAGARSCVPQASRMAESDKTPTPAAVVFKKSRREILDILHHFSVQKS